MQKHISLWVLSLCTYKVSVLSKQTKKEALKAFKEVEAQAWKAFEEVEAQALKAYEEVEATRKQQNK